MIAESRSQAQPQADAAHQPAASPRTPGPFLGGGAHWRQSPGEGVGEMTSRLQSGEALLSWAG